MVADLQFDRERQAAGDTAQRATKLPPSSKNMTGAFVWKFLSQAITPGAYDVSAGLGMAMIMLAVLIIFTLGYPPPTPTPTPLPF
jgi:hypothetical protein